MMATGAGFVGRSRRRRDGSTPSRGAGDRDLSAKLALGASPPSLVVRCRAPWQRKRWRTSFLISSGPAGGRSEGDRVSGGPLICSRFTWVRELPVAARSFTAGHQQGDRPARAPATPAAGRPGNDAQGAVGANFEAAGGRSEAGQPIHDHKPPICASQRQGRRRLLVPAFV